MSGILATVISVLHTVFWDDRTILILTNGEVKTPRISGWSPTYCASDRSDLDNETYCAGFTSCNECYTAWTPGMVRQGSVNDWHNNTVSTLQAQLAALKYTVENEMIEISKVQQVAHDYAQQQEWCSVYEEAMAKLGIEPLSTTDEIIITVTINATVEANRRQRAGDTDFMRQSINWSSLTRHLNDVDLFDSDYELTYSTVSDVQIELQ